MDFGESERRVPAAAVLLKAAAAAEATASRIHRHASQTDEWVSLFKPNFREGGSRYISADVPEKPTSAGIDRFEQELGKSSATPSPPGVTGPDPPIPHQPPEPHSLGAASREADSAVDAGRKVGCCSASCRRRKLDLDPYGLHYEEGTDLPGVPLLPPPPIAVEPFSSDDEFFRQAREAREGEMKSPLPPGSPSSSSSELIVISRPPPMSQRRGRNPFQCFDRLCHTVGNSCCAGREAGTKSFLPASPPQTPPDSPRQGTAPMHSRPLPDGFLVPLKSKWKRRRHERKKDDDCQLSQRADCLTPAPPNIPPPTQPNILYPRLNYPMPPPIPAIPLISSVHSPTLVPTPGPPTFFPKSASQPPPHRRFTNEQLPPLERISATRLRTGQLPTSPILKKEVTRGRPTTPTLMGSSKRSVSFSPIRTSREVSPSERPTLQTHYQLPTPNAQPTPPVQTYPTLNVIPTQQTAQRAQSDSRYVPIVPVEYQLPPPQTHQPFGFPGQSAPQWTIHPVGQPIFEDPGKQPAHKLPTPQISYGLPIPPTDSPPEFTVSPRIYVTRDTQSPLRPIAPFPKSFAPAPRYQQKQIYVEPVPRQGQLPTPALVKKALIVGLNYKSANLSRQLDGGASDAVEFRKMIRAPPFLFQQTKLLIDEPVTSLSSSHMEEPTKANILGGLRWLLSGHNVGGGGSSLIFYFSGCSSRVKQSNNASLLAEDALVPSDARDLIFATEIHQILKEQPLQSDSSLYVFLDCSSGFTLFPLSSAIEVDQKGEAGLAWRVSKALYTAEHIRRNHTWLDWAPDLEVREKSIWTDDTADETKVFQGYETDPLGLLSAPSAFFVFEASLPTQQAHEIKINGRARGIMTHCLLQMFEEIKSNSEGREPGNAEVAVLDAFYLMCKKYQNLKAEKSHLGIGKLHQCFALSFVTSRHPSLVNFLGAPFSNNFEQSGVLGSGADSTIGSYLLDEKRAWQIAPDPKDPSYGATVSTADRGGVYDPRDFMKSVSSVTPAPPLTIIIELDSLSDLRLPDNNTRQGTEDQQSFFVEARVPIQKNSRSPTFIDVGDIYYPDAPSVARSQEPSLLSEGGRELKFFEGKEVLRLRIGSLRLQRLLHLDVYCNRKASSVWVGSCVVDLLDPQVSQLHSYIIRDSQGASVGVLRFRASTVGC